MFKPILKICIISTFFFTQVLATNIEIKFKVENEIITNQDIINEINYLKLLNNKLNSLSNRNQENIAVNSLIQEKVKFIELRNFFDFDREDQQMEKLINFTLKKNLGIKNNNLDEFFKKNNLNLTEIKFKIKNEILWNKLIYDKYKSRLNIDEKNLREELSKMVSNRKKIEEFKLSEILFEVKGNEELNSKYQKILKSISNEGFKNTANIYSVSNSAKFGGQLGWIKKTQLSKKIQEIIADILIGETSKPIRSGAGFLIIKLDDKREVNSNINLENEFKKLRDSEMDRQLNQYSIYYFNRVKKNIFIDEL
tara:strand:- start:1962 stop:2891 length:930 start_codon:yes stop_codon:yes gene_type:complete